MRDACFKPSERAKEVFFKNPLFAFLFVVFGLFKHGQSFAFKYLTVKEKYSEEDSRRIIERIASLSEEAMVRLNEDQNQSKGLNAKLLYEYLHQ